MVVEQGFQPQEHPEVLGSLVQARLVQARLVQRQNHPVAGRWPFRAVAG